MKFFYCQKIKEVKTKSEGKSQIKENVEKNTK